jgi:uncharacterized membrane protein YhfC
MNPLIITYALNGLLMIAMPIGLAIFLTRRWKLGWGVWWIGFATFIISQVGHIPFNWVMQKLFGQVGILYWPQMTQMIFYAVFYGLSAGIFEEGARYLVLRFWAKKARSWRNGVLFGAGHGGVEAIILGALVLSSYVSMLVLRSGDLSTLVPAGQIELVQQQVAAYWSGPWYDGLLGAVERFLTIPCQIFMAVLVMQAFTRKNIAWLFAAIGFHALLDAVAVFSQPYVSVYILEGIVGVFSIVSIILTLVLRQPEPKPDSEPVSAPVEVPALKPVEETPENLDDSRYQK